jgi:hypothetical protein
MPVETREQLRRQPDCAGNRCVASRSKGNRWVQRRSARRWTADSW